MKPFTLWPGLRKLSLPILHSKMKSDSEGYAFELSLIYSQFNSSLDLSTSRLPSASPPSVGSPPTLLGDHVMFLARVAPFYLQQLDDFPNRLADFLKSSARGLPSGLRCHLSKALRLLINNKMVDIKELLVLFMELQTLGDKALRELAFSHIVHNIKRMNKKQKSEALNRRLQSVLFTMLQDEAMAKRALVTLCELHRRDVWFDDRTANAICTACFHPASSIMIAASSFLLEYEKIIVDSDSDDSSDDEETSHQSPQFLLSKEAFYKASHKGTAASKKKKKAKLQRAVRSMKKKQRLSSANDTLNCYLPLNHLKDAQVPNSDQLSLKRVDPAKLEALVKKKLSKEERLELVRAGREDRRKYQARAAVKQKKTGGLSNRQKEHKKFMPIAAKRVKAARSREEKRRKRNRAGKQFRGQKAWK
ncbi:hypothetical protein MLD38_019798 [Melastoma candidum]|uniref:Uncharacterized protein n=1 Tax=Melastoma candidum TaxID=119954 RepID=A0ACB9QCU2_9MYRT|nr:hypothetical protein MLD38_019798 [Melastoma candidum]